MADELPPIPGTPPAIATPTPSHVSNPPGWAPGAYQRFQEMSAENARLKEANQTLASTAGQVPVLQAAQQAAQDRHAMDMAMVRRSHTSPNLAHSSVMGMFRTGFAAYKSEGGTQPFDKWLDLKSTQADPLYGVHLTAPVVESVVTAPAETPAEIPAAQTEVPDTPAVTPTVPNVDGATIVDDQTQGAASYTDDQIEAIAADPAQWALHSKAIRTQMESKYSTRIGSGGD